MFNELSAKIRGAANWPQADATVSSCDWSDNSSARRIGPAGWYTVTFSYRVNGEYFGGDFTLAGSSTSSSPYQKNDRLVVHYDPRHPEKYFLLGIDDRKARAQLIATVFAIGFTLTLLTIGLLSKN